MTTLFGNDNLAVPRFGSSLTAQCLRIGLAKLLVQGRPRKAMARPTCLLKIKFSRARADVFETDIRDLSDVQQQIGGWRAIGDGYVAVASLTSVRASQNDGRRVVTVVLVSIAHAAAEIEQRMIEHGAIAVRSLLQLLYKPGELFHLPADDFGVLLHRLWIIAVVRADVMRLRHSNKVIAAIARFDAREERKYAADIALPRQVQ